MRSLIVIPARFQSTRFPGKPLTRIAGKTMLERVCEVAKLAASELTDVGVLVATDDERIQHHAESIGVQSIITPSSLPSGTDRVIYAIEALDKKPEFVLNLQGDTPLTPAFVIKAILEAISQSDEGIVTPVVQLTWDGLEALRKQKVLNPMSGTLVTVDKSNKALWFSKQIIPAIRNESVLRKNSDLSPVYRHLGLYAYKTEGLYQFKSLEPSLYETIEGLEQLRLIENGINIEVLKLPTSVLKVWRGVDTPEDASFIESMILQHGEPCLI